MATSISHNDDRDEVYFKQGSCNIILKHGDILDENDVDALVIPAPSSSDSSPDSYAIFKSIVSKADKDDKKRIENLRSDLKFLSPQVFVKKGRGYIFAVPPYKGNPDKARDLLKKTYTSCLKLAVKNKFRKIAFPTIGCGLIGFTTQNVAHEVYSALENFGRETDGKNMDEIRIVIYDSGALTDFTTVFMDLSSSRDAKIKFIDIASKKSNSTEMSRQTNERQISHQQSGAEDTRHDSGDFEDRTENERDRAKRKTSNLNPDSPDFQPKPSYQRRDLRRYLLSNKRTELHIFQGDILTTKVDAIVNAANETMLGGGGVDGIIHRAAGDELRRACKAHKQIYRDVRLPIGRSRILLSYNMSNTTYYIINTCGPRYDDHSPQKCNEYLTSCYKTSLALANLYDLETIGFTAISCGIFGYPIDEGAEVALKMVDSDGDSMKKILFVLKDDDIYDAWVKKAKELQFISLDDNDTVATNTSKQSTNNTGKVTEKTNANNKSIVSKELHGIKIIDASTPDSTGKLVERDHGNAPENESPNPNETFDGRESAENEEDANQSKIDTKTTKATSEKKKSDSTVNATSSNNSTTQKHDKNNDQNPEPHSGQKNAQKSMGSGGVGRGKKK